MLSAREYSAQLWPIDSKCCVVVQKCQHVHVVWT